MRKQEMKKTSVILLITFFISITLIGCNNNNNKFFDVNATADTLNEKLSFGETLEKSSAEALYSLFGIDSSLCTDAAYYAGSGATADEIAVISCIDSNAANTVLDAVNSHLKYLEDGYSSYGPDQVPKIQSAAVITSGNTVIMCICDNPDAVKPLLLSNE